MTTGDDSTSTGTRGDLAEVRRETTATPAEVWSVLCDGWSYASWVVGTSRIRVVENGWPAVGTHLHHSVGSWPVLLNDDTEVLESVPERRLVLQARGRPFGEAKVTLEIEPVAGGAVVAMLEDATHGPGRLMPRPVRQLMVVPRNRESLRRLAYLSERGSR